MRSRIRCPASAARRSCWNNRSSDDDRTLTRLICDEADRIVKLVDRMEVFADERPVEREPVNIHVVLDHVKRLAQSGFARHINFIEDYDPSLPPVLANRDQLIQVFLNLVKNAAEAIGDNATAARSRSSTAFRPGVRLSLPGRQGARLAAARILREGQRPGRARRTDAASVRSVRHHQADADRASGSRWSPRSSAIMAASSNASCSRDAPSFAC